MFARKPKQNLSNIALFDEKSIQILVGRIPSTYTHPVSHPATIITEDATHRFVTDTNKSAWDSKSTAPDNAQKNSDITKEEIEAKLIGPISTHTHAGGGGDLWTVIKLAEDFISSLAANTFVPNFFFTPVAGKTYLIFGYFLLRTATTTVGARPGVSWPSNITDSIMRMEAANSLTSSAVRTWGAQTTQNATSTGLATTTHSHWGSLDGIMITSPTVSGNFQITLASETAGTNVTMKAGSVLMYREI